MSKYKIITKANVTKFSKEKKNLFISIEKNLVPYSELLNQLNNIFSDYEIKLMDDKTIYLKHPKKESITIYIINK
ncbi:MAG TPA: hypothetical protein PLY35_08895 [Thermotogota bacterium]|nr:hypothetical protein [Thermotogota bacterium]